MDPNSTSAAMSEWKHWHRSLEYYVEDVEASATEERESVWTNYKFLQTVLLIKFTLISKSARAMRGCGEVERDFREEANKIFARHS